MTAAIAIARGARFLADAQDGDGFWRDYALPPGASTEWVTAFVGYALAGAGGHRTSIAHALGALRASCRATGWGYNASVATDADSTSWAVRWFARTGATPPIAAVDCLEHYLDPDGGARTFACGPRYGRWTIQHVDVTATLGLALSEAGAPRATLDRVRGWLLGQRGADGLWTSFWWTFDAYATARVLELLAVSGGIPREVRVAAASHLVQRVAETAMEAANLVLIARRIELDPEPWVVALRGLQDADGGWPASRVLRVPAQAAQASDEPEFEDGRRTMSTAMAMMALAEVA